MNDKPRAPLEDLWRGIAEIGSALVERTDRQESDISHNNAQIEALQAKVSLIGGAVVVLGAIILLRL